MVVETLLSLMLWEPAVAPEAPPQESFRLQFVRPAVAI